MNLSAFSVTAGSIKNYAINKYVRPKLNCRMDEIMKLRERECMRGVDVLMCPLLLDR